MLEAVTYQGMLNDISRNEIREDTLGILITRPDLEVGKSIMDSLNYYHHATGKNINFYLPGYGAYWYKTYPDGRIVSKIDGADWSDSDKMFVNFISDMEKYSKWEYSGESELLLLEYKDGILSFDGMMRFYLDDMLRDNVITSVSTFITKLSKVCKYDNELKNIRNTFGKKELIDVTKQAISDELPAFWEDVIKHEKYFCIGDYSK